MKVFWQRLGHISQLHIPLLAVFVAYGCAVIDKQFIHPPQVCYANPNEYNYTNYSFQGNRTTPRLGIQVDDKKNELDLDQVDQTAINVLNCLTPLLKQPMTADERAQNYCIGEPSTGLKPCLKIKVAEDWYTSQCNSTGPYAHQQIYPCTVPPSACEEKGEHPTAACPCSCRGLPQDENYLTPGVSTQVGDMIVLTPDLELLPQVLTMYITGCARPFSTRVVACSGTGMIAPKGTTQ